MIKEITPKQIANAIENLLDENEQLKEQIKKKNKQINEEEKFYKDEIKKLKENLNKCHKQLEKKDNACSNYKYKLDKIDEICNGFMLDAAELCEALDDIQKIINEE